MIGINKARIVLAVTIWITLWATACSCSAIFVSPAGNDSSDGLSWESSKKTVQAAINAAIADDEIWVAKGVYTYSGFTSDRIILKDRVSLYGGFSGTESAREQRNPSVNPTTLDGAGSTTSVIYSPANISNLTMVDGFVIRNGDNYVYDSAMGSGRGGIQCVSSSPVISNNLIVNNSVGISCMQSSPLIQNNRICGNEESGIQIDANNTLTTSTVVGNLIYGNGSSGDGGGIRCISGVVTITNNTIVGNSACLDGAIRLTATISSCKAILTNNLIAYNSSGVSVQTGATYTVTTEMRNNCVYGNTGYNYAGCTDPTGSDGNISQDPKMAAHQFGNFHLLSDSPCIDAGNDAYIQPEWVDIDSNSRTYGQCVDIGADEYDGTTWSGGPNAIVRVSPTGDDANDGLSWGQSKLTVQAGVDAASAAGGEVWVAQGAYTECVLLRPYAYLYGGFSGNETSKADRNWSLRQTILDGDGLGTVVSAFLGHFTSAVDGFTIRGGASATKGNARRGGGIVCVGASPEIANNIITQNTAYEGGGIYCDRSGVRIINNVIRGNSAEQGGAVYFANSYAAAPSLVPILTNNTIISNSASDNAGVYCAVPGTLLQNNIIAFNNAGVYSDNAEPIMQNNCVYGNVAYNFSGFAYPIGANGNISQDPVIVQDQLSAHILSNSPCIDSGDDTAVIAGSFDIDRMARISGNHVDIGADEFDGTVWGDGTNIVRVSQSIIKVSKSGDDSNDGLTWATAKLTVNAALATPGIGVGDQVWVAKGIYNERITVAKWISLYGGFAGDEVSLADRPAFPRINPDANETILDGQSSGSVVRFSANAGTTNILDGFTIRNGKASYGGGIYCYYSSPVISNNTITGNSASGSLYVYGGGIYCSGGSPTILNNTIVGNTAITSNGYSYGGGISCSSGSPMISNNVISGNTASSGNGYSYGGGAQCTNGSPMISNNVISGNTASSGNGCPYGGGIYCSGGSPTISNNTVASNSARSNTGYASFGGGIYYSSHSSISNNTIVLNTASSDKDSYGSAGGGIHIYLYAITISNNIVAFNSSGIAEGDSVPTLKNNCVYSNTYYNYSSHLSPSTGDIATDPLIVVSVGGVFHIQPNSPCRNAGNNSAPGMPSTDIDGQARPEGSAVDIGADESYGETWSFPENYAIHVSLNGNDNSLGLTWDTAKRTVTAGVNACVSGMEVWVAAGTYLENVRLRSGVAVYGGFAGTEVSRGERNWTANKTILDGNQSGSVVTSSYTSAVATTRIDGFTIRNGKAIKYGGGIYCYYSSLTIANNTITGNTVGGTSSQVYGGGICCIYGSPTISNNTITGNSANSSSFAYGGGIYCESTSSTISNNTIVGNTLSGSYCLGGGIECSSSSSTISNNIVAFNTSGIYGVVPTLQNNCVYGNTSYNYSGVSPGTGDISVDPLIVKSAGGVYHIQPTSPCRNAGYNSAPGMPSMDIDGQARLEGNAVDIGADESYGETWNPVVIYVAPNGNDSNNGLSWSLAKKTVQGALNASVISMEIWVAAGTYTENIALRDGVALYGGFAGTETSKGERNWTTNLTILDGNQSGSVVTIPTITTASTGIDGFTIRNGKTTTYGGGIYCSGGSPAISNNTITSNTASSQGGGIYCSTGTPVISNNTIVSNSGGGICCSGSSPAISNNTIASNSGGGIYCSSSSSPTVSNNTIVSNSSSYGGGINCGDSSATISNNTITGNTAITYGGGIYCVAGMATISGNKISGNTASSQGGGIYCSTGTICNNIITCNTASINGGGIFCYSSRPVTISNNTITDNAANTNGGGIFTASSLPAISNNIVAFNSSGIYKNTGTPTLRNNCVYGNTSSNYSGIPPGTGDISADPMFVDRINGNYHLKAVSPCINAGWNSAPGLPLTDMDGQKRIQGLSVDIGADEWWPGIFDVKKNDVNVGIELSGGIVSAAFSDCFYIESDNRACGIRVEKANHGLVVGDRADVSGNVAVNNSGELCIIASVASRNGSGTVTPLTLNNDSLGGGTFGLQDGVWGWEYVKKERVFQMANGLNNIGLLIKTWGKVIERDANSPAMWFKIDDGSLNPVKCILPDGVTLAPAVSYVAVTGISSCENIGGNLHRLLRVRTQSDIISH
ncbi:MAG: right-handed parallel beta-helix repeat-containing protein [Armatimonadetes bacterium]|nr:right-handed parallel beta-helix repeat-containing protein [Armatimonadota bacterium]